MKICTSQAAAAGWDHGGKRYLARDGILDVPDHVARDLLKDGCFLPSNQPRRADGFVCTDCGFHAYFRVCGKCGGRCERPTKETRDAQQA